MKGQPTKSRCQRNWTLGNLVRGLLYFSSRKRGVFFPSLLVSVFPLSDGIQILVLYSFECADTSYRDLESILIVEEFVASDMGAEKNPEKTIAGGKKTFPYNWMLGETWVPSHPFFGWLCNSDYWE